MCHVWLRCIIFLSSGALCCSLPAQQRDTSYQYKDQTGNLWRHTEQVTLSSPVRLPQTIRPSGEIRLKRFGSTTLEYSLANAGDNIRITVSNKEGIPFRDLSWSLDSIAPKNTAAYQHSSVLPDTVKAKLSIKPTISLRRQVAVVQLTQASARAPEMVRQITDSLLQPVTLPIRDSFYKKQIVPNQAPRFLDSWECSDRLYYEKGQLVTRPQPAQTRNLMPAGSHLLPRLGKTRKIPYSDFSPGDTLIFTATAQGEKPLKEISLTGPAGERISGTVNALAFADTIVVEQQSLFTLQLDGRAALRKQMVVVAVQRIRPMPADSFYVIVDSVFVEKKTSVNDTLLLTAIDDSLLLAPLWNIEQMPYGCLKVQVPLEPAAGLKLSQVAYWIGTGRNAVNDYLNLETMVPPDWALPGAPPALGAFGFGRRVVLPSIGTPDVICSFSKTRQTRVAKKPAAPLANIPNQRNSGVLTETEWTDITVPGKIEASGFRSRDLYACFQNTNTVNTYPVAIKVVGYYFKLKETIVEINLVKSNTYTIPFAKR